VSRKKGGGKTQKTGPAAAPAPAQSPRVYSVEILPEAEKALARLDRSVLVRVDKAIQALATSPRPPGAKALQGGEGLTRIRVGDWRVIYRIVDQRLLVTVIRVGHRGEVYDR
jgi:mRNA interferase RelE/StbE